MTMIPYERLLLDEVTADPRVMVLTAENRGHMRNIPPMLGDNFIDVGIAEQTMIGMAAGLAVRGRIVVTHALAAFLTMRAFEFIRTDVGIPSLPVIMVGMVPGFLSDGNGPTHQAIEDVSLMRTIPNMGVFCPVDEHDLILGMPHIIASGRPFYVRYTGQQSEIKHDLAFKIGKGEIVYQTHTVTDVAILTYGLMVHEAIRAAEELERIGITVKVINLRTLSPIDVTLLLDAVLSNALVVTLEDHFKIGGLYSILCELMVKHRVMCPVHPIALDNKWFRPGRLAEVIENEGFSARTIASRIRMALDNTSRSHHVTSVIG